MQVGIITVDGRQVGVVSQTEGDVGDTFTPDLNGYEPQGRASETPLGAREAAPSPHSGYRHHAPGHTNSGHAPSAPRSEGGHVVRQGSAEVDRAIVEAAQAHNLDPNTMRSIASIESDMNAGSNANRPTQYKGLYQIGHNEWDRFGDGGNIYSARDNAMGAARMFEANRGQFRAHYGRDPTDTELYMMHQQGLGFYTRGAMTNISGNPYPGMHGPQTHESFESGWGREVARRKAGYATRNPAEARTEEPPPKPFNPETDPL